MQNNWNSSVEENIYQRRNTNKKKKKKKQEPKIKRQQSCYHLLIYSAKIKYTEWSEYIKKFFSFRIFSAKKKKKLNF